MYVSATSTARVALHPEGVDRNRHIEQSAKNGTVALHPEGVDRNSAFNKPVYHKSIVALHPEGVDRNLGDVLAAYLALVALHPEGVDRNTNVKYTIIIKKESPSTRRAWIEILAAAR